MPDIRVGVRKASAETDATPLVLVYVTVGVVVVDGEAQAYALPVQYSMLPRRRTVRGPRGGIIDPLGLTHQRNRAEPQAAVGPMTTRSIPPDLFHENDPPRTRLPRYNTLSMRAAFDEWVLPKFLTSLA